MDNNTLYKNVADMDIDEKLTPNDTSKSIEMLEAMYENSFIDNSERLLVDISNLIGKTIITISGYEKYSDHIIIACKDGSIYTMEHDQECCEDVTVEDVYGDILTIIGTPILNAVETTNNKIPPADRIKNSYTWSFYTLATIKGYIDIRWFGTSNGCYSERVSVYQIHKVNE